MDVRGPLGPFEGAWFEDVLRPGPRESVFVPIHAISLIQDHELREVRLYAYVPEHGFRPLGGIYAVAERLESDTKPQARRLRIQDFVIARELRGRGIGSQMLTLFLRLARAEGFEYISGELSSQDAIDGSVAHLMHFYQRHGFKVVPAIGAGGILATMRFEIQAVEDPR
jgi:GNAT superfamily N-acetyltransferase